MAAKRMKRSKGSRAVKGGPKVKAGKAGAKKKGGGKKVVRTSGSTSSRPGPAAVPTQPMTPEEAEVADAISKLKIFAVILGVIFLGIIIYVVASMLTTQAEADRQAAEQVPEQSRTADAPDTTEEPIAGVKFRDEGDTVVLNGKRYPLLRVTDFQDRFADLVGKRAALKGRLINSEIYLGGYAEAKGTHTAFVLRGSSGGALSVYINKESGELLADKIKEEATGSLSAYVVVTTPKSRYKKDAKKPYAEMAVVYDK